MREIGGAQHSPVMLTQSKNFSMGVISVAVPAASHICLMLAVSQRKPVCVSLIVPALNAETTEAVGCCFAVGL